VTPSATPRVLEVGESCLFKQTWPETTRLLYAGPDRRAVAGLADRLYSPTARSPGAFDITVVYPPLEPPWARDTLLRLLRRREVAAMAALGVAAWGMGRPRATPLAVLDMHDESEIPPHRFGLLLACDVYFKRELPADPRKCVRRAWRSPPILAALDRVRPLSLGLPPHVLDCVPPPLGKTTDLFFAGASGHAPAIRGAGIGQLEALAAQGVRVDLVRERLPIGAFLERCARARLTWSPEGLGWDCFRHYEAAACRSVPVINQPGVRRYQPLRDGEHAFYYPVEGDGLARIVRAALAAPDRLAAMGEAARQHVLAHHTHAALCRHVVQTCLAARQPRA